MTNFEYCPSLRRCSLSRWRSSPARRSSSLFLGIWSGAVIYTGGLGIVQTFDWIVAAIVADDGFQATILVFTLLLGSGVAMVWNLGGTYAIRDWAIERLDTQRKAGLAAWVLGVILFFSTTTPTPLSSARR